MLLLCSSGNLYPQEFQKQEISENVLMVYHPDLGSQVVVRSEKGLVVFNSFWSEHTAGRFKEEISKHTGRRDFSYVINMIDRLDLMGGNAVYREATLVGQENILSKYSSEASAREEIAELVDMWREKAGYSRDRLKNFDPGSEEAAEEKSWLDKCLTMADELEHSFSLVLPGMSFKEETTLDLGQLKIHLLWFGKAGNYQALSAAVIPEEKLAITSMAIFNPELHLAPYPFPFFGELDVPRWIKALEFMLDGESKVDQFILCDGEKVYSRELMQSHLDYIRKLWYRVKELEAEGRSLGEIQDLLSLDHEFDFVKHMQVYKRLGDAWIRPQHEMHLRLFFLQDKTLASRIIREGGPDSLPTSLEKIREAGSAIYFDEISMNFLGSEWLHAGKTTEALEIFKLNAEAFPESSSAYSSLGIAYMQTGDAEHAMESCKQSLVLDPENQQAARILEQLDNE